MGVRWSSPRTANSRTAVRLRPTASPRRVVGRVCTYLDDISPRYLGSIYRGERSQHRGPFPGRQPAVHIGRPLLPRGATPQTPEGRRMDQPQGSTYAYLHG